jgi:hypothetical protein
VIARVERELDTHKVEIGRIYLEMHESQEEL